MAWHITVAACIYAGNCLRCGSMASAGSTLLPAISLCRRELVRFLRQRNRVIGAFATPIVFWLLIGGGMGKSFQSDGLSGGYMEYFFPGTILMILLFTAIFSTISIIEDRREGISAIRAGCAGGARIDRSGQSARRHDTRIRPGADISPSCPNRRHSSDDHFVFAGQHDDADRFVCSDGTGLLHRLADEFDTGISCHHEPVFDADVVFSGALFPASKAWKGLRWVMEANPLSYGMDGLRRAMYWHETSIPLGAKLWHQPDREYHLCVGFVCFGKLGWQADECRRICSRCHCY